MMKTVLLTNLLPYKQLTNMVAYFVSDNNFSAPENQLVVGTVSVNDIDANDIHSFSSLSSIG